jgi:type VI secretion system secreted protein VgrG
MPGGENQLRKEPLMARTLSANTSRFVFEAGGIRFLVVAFSAQEAISHLYSVRLELAFEQDVATCEILGRPALLTIHSGEQDRLFHGLVHHCRRSGKRGRFYLFHVLVGPQVRLLDHRTDCRIFQDRTVPQIVREVLVQAGLSADAFADRLTGHYPMRPYCVQYRESDLCFVRRLLQEEGIFFFFEHSREGHVMVFGDSPANYNPLTGNADIAFNPGGGLAPDQETVLQFRRGQSITSDAYALRDYTYEKPGLDLGAQSSIDGAGALAAFDYPGLYDLPEQGRRLARVRLEAVIQERDKAEGQSVVTRFTPCRTFTLGGAEADTFAGEYLLTGLTHRGEQPAVLDERSDSALASLYLNEFEAVPAATSVRPADPALIKRIVQGSQTAIVTGPEGEEIYTDRHGRVKVKFHWDRAARADERRSCWMRVSQNWAGPGWGALFIPRIGQEVIVDFLEGDPDRPIITGRVYHSDNYPPYPLPAEKTKSTLKSSSSPGGQGFNEIRFEDRKDEEQLFIHAQKDMDLCVKNDRRTVIGNDAHLIVTQNLHEQIDAACHRIIKGDRLTRIDGACSCTVTKDRQEKIGGHYGLSAGRQIHLCAGNDLVLEAASGLTLKAGTGFIILDGAGVAMGGTKIRLNSGGTPGTGRGVFAVAPLAPLLAGTSPPSGEGMVSHTLNKSDGSKAAAHDSPASSPQDLSARLRRRRSTCEGDMWFTTGYELEGPRRIKSPQGFDFYYSVYHPCVPAGQYSLSFEKSALNRRMLKSVTARNQTL